MQRQVSVVIPCYNVEKWIEKCLDSIEKQTIGFENIEVVLVNDASTDSTLVVLEAFCEKYPENTKLINYPENLGASNARRAGMNASEGEYLFFVDSDDWIAESTLEKMYGKALETGLEMIKGGFRTVADESQGILIRCGEDWKKDFSNKNDVKWFLTHMPHLSVVDTLYKRAALVEHGLQLPENCRMAEDVYFSGLATFLLNGCYFINEQLYYYRNHPGSLSWDVVYNTEKNRLIVWAAEEMLSELRKRGIYENVMQDYYHEIAWYIIGPCYFFVLGGMYREIEYFKAFILKYFPDILDNAYLQILDDMHREYLHFFRKTPGKNNISEVRDKIRETPERYELYEQLGGCLYDKNLKQSYLCYQHAYELCNDEKKRQELLIILHQIARDGGNVPKTTIVILNYNLKDVTRDCVESIRATTDEISRDIIIVDNGSTDGSVDFFGGEADIKLVASTDNLGFPGGCNRGIEASEELEDILLLNNDTVLCDHSLFWLRMGLYEKESNGIVGAVSNHVIGQQKVCEDQKDLGYYYEVARERNIPNDKALQYCFLVSGFAMLIRRKTLTEIGLLNEAYAPGYYEDCDLCLRAIIKGWQVAIVHNSFIIHWGGKSFTFASVDYKKLLNRNRKYLEDLFSVRYDDCIIPDQVLYGLQDLNELKSDAKLMVINCGNALSLLTFKWQRPDVRVVGVDTHVQTTVYAVKQEAIEVSIYFDNRNLLIKEEKFDSVVLCLRKDDPKELSDYWECVTKYLSDSGTLMVIGDNCNYYKNWISSHREGKKSEYPIGGFRTINHVDGFLNAHGYNVQAWTTIFGLPTGEELKLEVKQAAEDIGITWDQASSKAFAIKARKRIE